MKKIYCEPLLLTVNIEVESHLMDLSNGGTASISGKASDGDAFTKGDNSDWNNIWDEQ